MLDPKEQAEIDQSAAWLGENLPPLYRSFYKGLVAQGFSDAESFKLLQTYILAQCPNGIRGGDG